MISSSVRMKRKLAGKIKLIIQKRKKSYTSKRREGADRFRGKYIGKNKFSRSGKFKKLLKFGNNEKFIIRRDGECVSRLRLRCWQNLVSIPPKTSSEWKELFSAKNDFSNSRNCPSAELGLTRSWLVRWGPTVQEVRPCSWSLLPSSWRLAPRWLRSSQRSPKKECPTGQHIPAIK